MSRLQCMMGKSTLPQSHSRTCASDAAAGHLKEASFFLLVLFLLYIFYTCVIYVVLQHTVSLDALKKCQEINR